MDFLKKNHKTIMTYAKACPLCAVIFLTCAIVTDENGAWLVAYILIFATIITSLLAQFAQDFRNYRKSETETPTRK
ncbi:MAG: hypothetical protein NC095_03635 [Muribaculum sp.]|nr:hypothetical protein [Muribaculum sp.]